MNKCIKVPTTAYYEGEIISFFRKNINYPITRGQKIASYRKKHAAIRHEYYSLCDKHSSLSRCMFTFTVGGRGRGVYTKLRIINEVKSYLTYLIANSKANIYYFSNIEVGAELTNPHLHSQIWFSDENAVKEIYERVIKKFRLNASRCTLSEPQRINTHYNYTIKDYSPNLNDNEIWHLEETKKRMRKQLGLQLRFYSRSKSKYTSKLYKMVYHSYQVLRALADKFLDFMVSTFFVKRSERKNILENKKHSKLFFISSFITSKNKEDEVCLLGSIFLIVVAILFFSPCRGPPTLSLYIMLCVKNLF